MIFLFEEKISDFKRINLSLKECLGLGKTCSIKLYYDLGFNIKKNYKIKDTHTSHFSFIKLINNLEHKITYLNQFLISDDKKKVLERNMKLLKQSNCLRWRRHFQKLPVRAQHTRTNARTQKSRRGFRKSLPIAGKKK